MPVRGSRRLGIQHPAQGGQRRSSRRPLRTMQHRLQLRDVSAHLLAGLPEHRGHGGVRRGHSPGDAGREPGPGQGPRVTVAGAHHAEPLAGARAGTGNEATHQRCCSGVELTQGGVQLARHRDQWTLPCGREHLANAVHNHTIELAQVAVQLVGDRGACPSRQHEERRDDPDRRPRCGLGQAQLQHADAEGPQQPVQHRQQHREEEDKHRAGKGHQVEGSKDAHHDEAELDAAVLPDQRGQQHPGDHTDERAQYSLPGTREDVTAAGGAGEHHKCGEHRPVPTARRNPLTDSLATAVARATCSAALVLGWTPVGGARSAVASAAIRAGAGRTSSTSTSCTAL